MSPTISRSDIGERKADIREHLRQLLADRRFASAERNANFLRYVVETTLCGKAGEIKETVIATEVYGRSSDYDPKADSIVRVEASRLRQKLRSYYENEGNSARIRFSLPSGTYVPVFETLETVEVPEPTKDPVPERNGKTSPAAKAVALHASVLSAVLWLAVQFAPKIPKASPADPEAMAAWQEGAALLQQDPHAGATDRGAPKTLLRAIERLEFAVARSPEAARPWATLAEAYDYAIAYVGRDSAEDARRAEAAARRAIALDGSLAAGHHMLGLALGSLKWDFQGAKKAYDRALALEPNNVYAVIEYADLLRETGEVESAANLLRKARALLPALPQLAVKEAEIQLDLHRPDAAIAAAKSAIELKGNYLRAHLVLGMAYETKGDYQQALTCYEHVLQANPFDRRTLPAYGYLLAVTGRTEQANKVLARLEQMNLKIRNCAFQIAVVHLGLGDMEPALDWLERAWHTRQAHFPFASVEYRFRSLHGNARFCELLKRVGLKPVRLGPDVT